MTTIDDVRGRATLDVPTAAELLGISTWSVYAAIKRGEIPALRIGRKLFVPTAQLLRMLGHTTDDAA